VGCARTKNAAARATAGVGRVVSRRGPQVASHLCDKEPELSGGSHSTDQQELAREGEDFGVGAHHAEDAVAVGEEQEPERDAHCSREPDPLQTRTRRQSSAAAAAESLW
jgi:hypothetical protein